MCHYQTPDPYHGVKSLTGGLNTYLASDYCMRGCACSMGIYSYVKPVPKAVHVYKLWQLQAVHAPDIVQSCILTQCAHFHASHTRETSISYYKSLESQTPL